MNDHIYSWLYDASLGRIPVILTIATENKSSRMESYETELIKKKKCEN